jgi:HTH-type transcriptional regulator / antitoxin HigA
MATRVATGSRYMELVARFPLRPIRSDAELDRAAAALNALLDLRKRSRDDDDYMHVLGTLIEEYETEHHPMPPVSGVNMLKHLIDARQTTQTKVAEGAGLSLSTVSEILAGKRKLNTRHIASLARFFGVDPGLFIDG